MCNCGSLWFGQTGSCLWDTTPSVGLCLSGSKVASHPLTTKFLLRIEGLKDGQAGALLKFSLPKDGITGAFASTNDGLDEKKIYLSLMIFLVCDVIVELGICCYC